MIYIYPIFSSLLLLVGGGRIEIDFNSNPSHIDINFFGFRSLFYVLKLMLNYSGCSVSSDYEYRFIIGYFYFQNYHDLVQYIISSSIRLSTMGLLIIEIVIIIDVAVK